VENAGLAIAETSRLLTVPGRVCSNGRPVPVASADWIKYTADLRKAGLAAYAAAKKKSTDAMGEVSGTVSDACQACHDKYREKKGGEKDRCLP
jgi:cytochrome c553